MSASASNSATLTTNKIEGELTRLEVKSLYKNVFRTSKYSTFADKMKATSITRSVRMDVKLDVFQLASYLLGDEVFDKAEVEGSMYSAPLIGVEADVNGNDWYENRVYPLVYEGYPLLNKMYIKDRDISVMGLPPVRNVFFRNFKDRTLLDEQTMTYTPASFAGEVIVYNLNASVHTDYYDLQGQVANYDITSSSYITPRLLNLLMSPTPRIRKGTYNVKLTYTVPGLERSKTTYTWGIVNTIPDND